MAEAGGWQISDLARSQADTALSGARASQLKQAGLRKACRMFESYFLQLMLKEMRKTIPESGLVNRSQAEKIFTDLMDQSLADRSTQAGSMGLADMLERQLAPKLARSSNSPSAAQASDQAGQAPDQAESAGQPLSGGLPSPATAGSLFRGRVVYPSQAPAQTPAQTPAQDSAVKLEPPVNGRVSSLFGMRLHPISGQWKQHDGLDLAAPQGTPIQAAAAGEVVQAGTAEGYGNTVVLEHADGSQTLYGHCHRLKVRPGQMVEQGQVIATVGSSGVSTGPHLHFEISDAQGRLRDPMRLVAFVPRTLA